MDSQVANVYAKAERSDVKLAEFDASTGDFLSRGDYAAADLLLKRIGRDVPAKKAEGDYAENAEGKK
jgi:hypothetical protein